MHIRISTCHVILVRLISLPLDAVFTTDVGSNEARSAGDDEF